MYVPFAGFLKLLIPAKGGDQMSTLKSFLVEQQDKGVDLIAANIPNKNRCLLVPISPKFIQDFINQQDKITTRKNVVDNFTMGLIDNSSNEWMRRRIKLNTFFEAKNQKKLIPETTRIM